MAKNDSFVQVSPKIHALIKREAKKQGKTMKDVFSEYIETALKKLRKSGVKDI